MKKNKKFKLIMSGVSSAVLLVCIWFFDFLNEEIRFSRQSGFYEEPFYLEISAGRNEEIYYTLNGSIPDRNSPLSYKYEEPIYLDNASVKDNIWANASDMSEYFYDMQPEYRIDKAHIIRAIAYDEEGNMGEIISGTYFVGLERKKYENIPVISLVVEPDDFWGNENGIYVKGITYDNFPELTDTETVRPSDYAANYNQHGRKWERECLFQYFPPGAKENYSQNLGIRIKGAYSRNFAQKSLNLYARNVYGIDEINCDFFNEGDLFIKESSITLNACGWDKKTKLKDALVSKIVDGLDIVNIKHIPCIVFLNGEYWGVYQLTENPNANYISNHYGIDKDNVVIIKNGELTEGTETDFDEYQEMLKWVQTTDLSEDGSYEKIESLIDVQSFMDYYAVEIYINNCDWPDNNVAMWKSREKGPHNCEDSKWRWILFDLNDGKCMRVDKTNAGIQEDVYEDILFSGFMRNERFRKEFIENFERIAEENFEKKYVQATTMEMAEYMKFYLEEDYRRFRNMYSLEGDFETALDSIEQFLKNRGPFIIEHVNDLDCIYSG